MRAPGSEIPGVPASEISATASPACSFSTMRAAASCSLCWWAGMVRAWAPSCFNSGPLWRVSSAATQGTLRRISSARRVRSARFPSGVGTTYNAADSSVIFISMQAKANDTTTARGREAEDRAARYLERSGLRVIERNFRVRGGEIDLICRDGRGLVFVEVRQRSRTDFGGAGASITTTKQRRIILAARHYLAGKADCDCRFDCVLIDGGRLTWLRHAFSADA